MAYVYPNSRSVFIGFEETALENGYIFVDDDICADLLEGKMKWEAGEIVPDPNYVTRVAKKEAREEISALKKRLEETDYVVIKIAEGAAERSEYADVIEQRAEWRARINELEEEEP